VSTSQISQNLIQINRFRFVNAFLVREDDGFTVVDTTVGGGAEDFMAKKSRSLGPAMLVVGHGGPVRAPAAELDKAIARAGG
jgi:hypothetical protein